jgi:hypothetical protein
MLTDLSTSQYGIGPSADDGMPGISVLAVQHAPVATGPRSSRGEHRVGGSCGV